MSSVPPDDHEDKDDDTRIELLRSMKVPEIDRIISDLAQAKGTQGSGASAARVDMPANSSAAALRNEALMSPSARKAAALKVAMGESSQEDARRLDANHRFWSTQPVPAMSDQHSEDAAHAPVEPAKQLSEVSAEPYNLPDGFEWVSIDVSQDAELQETYELLSKNYVEDDDAMFRFAYPIDFLRWGLTPPHYHKDWHVGVRVTKTRKLVACITGVPATLDLYGRAVPICEINYLCVHKKLRSKRLAPMLIKEVTRRVNLRGIWQAAYTAGVVLPRPVASCRYYHRSIDPKKLIEIGFSRLDPRTTMQLTVRKAKLPSTPLSAGIRAMLPSDVPSAAIALNRYLAQTSSMRPIFTAEEVAHWLLPREGVIDCVVVPRKETRKRAREILEAAVQRIEAHRQESLKANPREAAGGTNSVGGDEAAAAEARQIVDWEKIIKAAVGEGAEDDEVVIVTDLVSFYHLPSIVIRNPKYTHLYAAYLYYYVADSIPLKQLLLDALIIARDKGIDVFNCLELLQNSEVFKDLQYIPGDGCLQYCAFCDESFAHGLLLTHFQPSFPFPQTSLTGAALK